MTKLRFLPIAIAIPTAIALIAFAYVEKHMMSPGLSSQFFFVAAAVIALAPSAAQAVGCSCRRMAAPKPA